jgi:hypothetical protein
MITKQVYVEIEVLRNLSEISAGLGVESYVKLDLSCWA